MDGLIHEVREYLQSLEVTQGAKAGSRLELLPWENRFLRGVLKDEVQTGALSVARGNGKTVIVSGLCCAALDGPLAVPRGETLLVASSFGQARIAFDHVKAFMGPKLDGRKTWRVQDSANLASIENRRTGAKLKCIGSDPRRAHGLAPVLVLADEPAQWPPSTGERMVAALRTAAGKQPHSLFLALGTRPAGSGHWFARLLEGGADYAQVHAAKEDDPPFRKATWKKANPSMAYMPDLEKAIRSEVELARKDPSAMAAFKALRLNLGVADVAESYLLEAPAWRMVEAKEEVAADGPFILGLDLGQSAAMSAAAAYWPRTGLLRAMACFPELPDIETREAQDSVVGKYQAMLDRGELMLAGRRVSDIHALINRTRREWGNAGILTCDRWREAELRQTLEEISYPFARLVIRGQGFKDGSEDVRNFRTACLRGEVHSERSLLLRMAMSEARCVGDPAGNWKLAKNSEGGRRALARDDAAAAAILAVSEGVRSADIATESGPFMGFA